MVSILDFLRPFLRLVFARAGNDRCLVLKASGGGGRRGSWQEAQVRGEVEVRKGLGKEWGEEEKSRVTSIGGSSSEVQAKGGA